MQKRDEFYTLIYLPLSNLNYTILRPYSINSEVKYSRQYLW